mmetsp:Transcript_16667/g.16761  ORF Transcript_16667/g.16761 Transcript_16667/m.16761 type:complete len:304 (+) Transcript_16667:180-1091(+)
MYERGQENESGEHKEMLGKKLDEHHQRVQALEEGLRHKMIQKQKQLELRLQNRRRASHNAGSKGEEISLDANMDSEDKIGGEEKEEDPETELKRMNEVIERVISLLGTTGEASRVQELDVDSLVRSVDTMLRMSKTDLTQLQSLPLPLSESLPPPLSSRSRDKRGSHVYEGMSPRYASSNNEIKSEVAEHKSRAKSITRQYQEEKEKHDLELLVLQARQKQNLQRKLLMRNKGGAKNATNPSNSTGVVPLSMTALNTHANTAERRDPNALRLPASYDTKIVVGNISGDMASRGMSMAHLQRRK